MTVRDVQRATQPQLWLIVMEYTCLIYFTLELIARTIFCPDKRVYCKHLLTWVDVLSLLPVYVILLVLLVDSSLEDSAGLYVLKAFRVIRIFRIMRLTRYFSGLKILGHTLKASAKELLLMILVLGIGVLVFACFIYYVEQVEEGEKNDFKNIPIGFWWAVVTMTTLGYGDTYPRTALGYIVGAICALCGLLMLALPVPVIVNNFTLYYSHAQAKLKLPQKKKNVLVGAADALKSTETAESSMDISHEHERVQQGSHSSMDSLAGCASVDAKDVGDTRDLEPGVCRKGSDHSAHDSVDSGFKTGSASTNGGDTMIGISVIFTDELATSSTTTTTTTTTTLSSSASPSSRLSPPTTSTPATSTSIPDPNSNPNPASGSGAPSSSGGISRRTSDKRRNSIHFGANRKASSRRRSLRPSNMRVDIVDVDV